MKKLAALAISAALLMGATACGTVEPVMKPTVTPSISATECYKAAFDHLKKERGVQYLIDHKEAANAFVAKVCS